MDIKLKERRVVVLKDLDISSTFKIDGSSFVFMKMGVDGLTVVPKKIDSAIEEPKPIKVQVPEGRTPVLCLNTGKAQFLKLDENVQIVKVEANEILDTMGKKEN